MVDVPPFDEPPVTTPVDEPIVATAVALLVHVPPVFGSLKLTVLPLQTIEDPVIAPGVWLTVTVTVVGVPQPLLKVTVAVPAVTG